MNVLIVEDEAPAADKLERYLHKYDPKIEVLAKLPTVSDTSQWLTTRQQDIDLIFMDIQLTDGLSFEIFRKVEVSKPVVFTTAFDEYTLDAFKVNSIAYLLKPITFLDLSATLKKYESMKAQFGGAVTSQTIHQLASRQYKERFMVKVGDHIRTITTESVRYFYAEGRTIYLVNEHGRRYIIDFNMEKLQEALDPKIFYRINRTYIVNINAIYEVLVYSNSRLKVQVSPKSEMEMIVSREKVTSFKDWLSGGS